MFVLSAPVSPFRFHRLEGWFSSLNLVLAFFNRGKIETIVYS